MPGCKSCLRCVCSTQNVPANEHRSAAAGSVVSETLLARATRCRRLTACRNSLPVALARVRRNGSRSTSTHQYAYRDGPDHKLFRGAFGCCFEESKAAAARASGSYEGGHVLSITDQTPAHTLKRPLTRGRFLAGCLYHFTIFRALL